MPDKLESEMKKPRKIVVSAEDQRLFAEAIGPVRPLAPTPEVFTHDAPRPLPEPLQSQADEARVAGELMFSEIDPAAIEIGEELSYLKAGLSPRLLRQLKRGQFSIADEIDLHQMNAEVARAAVVDFMADAKRRGLHCIKVIHGKGLRSRAGGPVIKRLVDKMLRQRDDVVAFASARSEQGGTGATVVLLRYRG